MGKGQGTEGVGGSGGWGRKEGLKEWEGVEGGDGRSGGWGRDKGLKGWEGVEGER